MANTLAQLCIKYVELSRGFGRARFLLWGFNLFSLAVFRVQRVFLQKKSLYWPRRRAQFQRYPLARAQGPPPQTEARQRKIDCLSSIAANGEPGN